MRLTAQLVRRGVGAVCVHNFIAVYYLTLPVHRERIHCLPSNTLFVLIASDDNDHECAHAEYVCYERRCTAEWHTNCERHTVRVRVRAVTEEFVTDSCQFFHILFVRRRQQCCTSDHNTTTMDADGHESREWCTPQ
jgi:DNA replication protein DnaC